MTAQFVKYVFFRTSIDVEDNFRINKCTVHVQLIREMCLQNDTGGDSQIYSDKTQLTPDSPHLFPF